MVARLVGRVEELARLCALLGERGPRIVTLWGPGGIGKTRLAIEAAAAYAEQHRSSVFCALEGARRPHDVVKALAQALDVTAADALGIDEAVAQIGRALAARGEMLVVLDNAEQVVSPVARAVESWCAQAPEVKLLVTSRELLGVAGETPLEVLPLTLPRDDDVAGSEAVQLLLDRARAVRPEVTAEPLVLQRIVERLDGIPLAIELAAARLSVLSAEQLLSRLDRRFDVLSRTHGGGEQRQRTLRGALDWSWELLGAAEQELLADLSVFHGGFDLAAVEAILGGDVLDALVALRHKSLVASSLPGAAEALEPRFRLLESVRDYAGEHLGARAKEILARHASYYVGAASARAERVDQSGGIDALAWLAREQHNVLTVVHTFLSSPAAGSAARALDALVAVEPVLATWGPVALLAELLTRTLDTTAAFEVPAASVARALGALGRAQLALGQLADADATLDRAMQVVDGADNVAIARLTNSHGDVKYVQGLFAEAEALHRKSVVHAERAGVEQEKGLALTGLGMVHHILGDADEARAHYERALAVHGRVGNLRADARTRAHLGFLLHDVGLAEEALACFEAALKTARDVRSRGLEGMLLGYLGNAMRVRGRLDEARKLYAQAMSLLRAVGDRRFLGCVTMYDGIALLLEQEPSEARAVLAGAATLAFGIGDTRLVALIAAYEASACAALGDAPAARAAIAHGRAATTAAVALAVVDLHEAYVDLVISDAAPAARARLSAARAHTPATDHLRVGQHLLARALETREPPLDALVITDGADQVRPPSAPWVDLSSRPVLRRLVSTLVEHRLREPGAPLATEVLVRAGWPGERVVRAAGANRLRVAVATLRASGMKGVLQRSGGGYLLDATVHVVRLKTPR